MCIILIHIFSPGPGIDLRSRGAKLEIAKRQNYVINITSIHAHTDVLYCHSLADNYYIILKTKGILLDYVLILLVHQLILLCILIVVVTVLDTMITLVRI